MKKLTEIVKDSSDSIKRNFYISTLMAAGSALVSAPLEIFVLDMNKYISSLARVNAWELNYLSFPLTKAMRDWGRRRHGLVGDTSLKALASDAIYPAIYSAITVPMIYLLAGESDPKKIIYPTLFAIGTNIIKHVGGYYLQDKFEGLRKRINGWKEKNGSINKQEKYKKNVLRFAGASIIALTIFYNSLPNELPKEKESSQLEQITQEEVVNYQDDQFLENFFYHSQN